MDVCRPHPLPTGGTLRYRLPPRVLWVTRTDEEVHLCIADDDTPEAASENVVEAAPAAPAALVWERFATPVRFDRVCVRPVLPDRPLVVRPAASMRILKGHTTRLFVGIPVWWQVEVRDPADTAAKLAEYPSAVLSKSWFGLPTDGEPCYALKTRARHAVHDLTDSQNRAVCVIDLRNDGDDNLMFERFCLRVPNLALFMEPDGKLWTGDVHVTFRGADEATQIRHGDQPPAAAPRAEKLSPPRTPAPRRFTLRAFEQVRALAGML